MVAPRLAVVVTAAGRSERFGGGKKELEELGGSTILDLAVRPFLSLPDLAFLVVTAPPCGLDEARAALSPGTIACLGDRLRVTAGGPTRRDSVRLGLETIAKAIAKNRCDGLRGTDSTDGGIRDMQSDLPLQNEAEDLVVLVHDGARPWASPALASRVAAAAREKGAALPVLPITETPKRVSPDGAVLEHPPRAGLAGAQTPQGFRFAGLLEAHRRAQADDLDCTDDAELWAHYVGPVSWVEGERENRKVTYREDVAPTAQPMTRLPARQGADAAACPFRVGQGWDLHRLAAGRRLMLGGVEVPAEVGEEAHSDGDVLLHSIIDALLGAASLGDIGLHFPPSDERWKDADSSALARITLGLVRDAGWEPVNLDCTIVLEHPKIGPWREDIRASVAGIFDMDAEDVSIKAKTSEGVDAVGRGEAVASYAVVLMRARS